MNIVVLGGGDSPERAVSLRSAASVKKSLEESGFSVTQIDPIHGLATLDKVRGDIVFPILHGQGGEDGVIQEELEKRQIPYLGTTSKASAVCFDKALTREALISAGLSVAKGDVVTKQNYYDHALKQIPHVLKVSRGGSSIGTYIVRDPALIDRVKVKEVFSLDDEAVIEELIEGVEISVPVLDTKASPVIEIVPPLNQEFDYENKYNGKTKDICPSISLGEQYQRKAQLLAEEVHKVLGARHLSRTDIIVKSNGEMVILELNTMPGMTAQSLYPVATEKAGYAMPELMRKFVALVERDYKLAKG